MIERLRDSIAHYATAYSDLNSWSSIRKNYGAYSYLAFLCLIVYDLHPDRSPGSIRAAAETFHLTAPSVLELIMELPGAALFMDDMSELARSYPITDLNSLYQEYLSQDFILCDGTVSFSGGKNSRDVLGSYYTQESFAHEITEKAIQEFCSGGMVRQEPLHAADFSCGGGAFLIAAYRICKKKHIPIELYGYDVDPIALLITKSRLYKEMGADTQHAHILLGNPLLQQTQRTSDLQRFQLSSMGRFYHPDMGIDIQHPMDVIVGNPPWEKIRFEEKKFLRHYLPDAVIGTKSERSARIHKTAAENSDYFNQAAADYEFAKKSIKSNPFFKRSSCGELNTYALFTELSLNLLGRCGVAGLIVKSSLVKLPVYSTFFQEITNGKQLYELYMFTNKNRLFPIDSREEFSVLYLKKGNQADLKVALNLNEYAGFTNQETLELPCQLWKLFNPDTGMIPNIRSNHELGFLCAVYQKHKTFGEVYPDCRFGRLVHLTNHSASIKKQEEDHYLPIYEGKFIELYTGKYATFKDMSEDEKYQNKASASPIQEIDGTEYPESRYFIRDNVWEKLSKHFHGDYIVAWRSLTSSTNRRTMLATLLPLIPTCQSIQLLQLPQTEDMLQITALFNSIIFDYIVRLKMVGLDLTQTIIKQIPVPDKARFYQELHFQGRTETVAAHIYARLSALYQNDIRLLPLFHQLRTYPVQKARKELIAELDKLTAFLYEISKDELRQIACSFDKYYTKEEVENWF